MPDVFLTHASEDKPRVRALAEALSRDGLEVWWDEQIAIGDAWGPEIVRKIEESRCIVVCWSESAVKKALSSDKLWIRSEVDAAIRRGVIMAVLLEEVQPPMPYDQVQTRRLIGWRGDRSSAEYKAFLEEVRNRLEAHPQGGRAEGGQPAKRRALLIGVRGGHEGLPRLAAVDGNLKGLEGVLKQPDCGFEVVKLVDPTYQELTRGLKDFFRACGPGGLTVVYYCGHVRFDDDGVLRLTAGDTREDEVGSMAVSLSSITRGLDKLPEGQRLLILDGCYADADAARVKDALLSRPVIGGKVILASGAGKGGGPESWAEQYSPLTGYMLRALGSTDADSNEDQVVTAKELFEYARRQLEGTRRSPEPHFSSVDCDSSQVMLSRRADGRPASLRLGPEQVELVRLLAPELDEGNTIVFLGDGIFSTGPLSGYRLTSALAEAAGLSTAQRDEGIIPTPAEWLEQLHRRGLFLKMFRKILESQAAGCLPSAAHDLVLEMKRPWLTISATYDDLLERRLDEAGVPYVTLAHILRSKTGEDDNKMLVMRNRHHPAVKSDPRLAAEVCIADEVLVEDEDCIVYKLLGSPYHRDLPIAKERDLDTTAVTETDYMTFLTALRQSDTTPTALSTRLEGKRILFLGFNLHLWHYRLLGHLFNVTGSHGAARTGVLPLHLPPIVIPPPATSLEATFWKRFNPAMLVEINLPTLVKALRAERSAAV